MIILRLALQSLFNRRLTACLTILSIALGVGLLLGVEKVRTGARQSFANTISGTDLIVGARGSGLELLLYSVFRIGNGANNFSWKTYQEIAARPEIAWIAPISLGDAHRGFRVMGVDQAYFEHYRYRAGNGLELKSGALSDDLFDTVLGSDVAEALGYKLNQSIVVSHGIGNAAFQSHSDRPFRVAGILKKTGTPVDRTVHVSLAAIEAIHIDWQPGLSSAKSASADDLRKMQFQPGNVTAAFVGLKSKLNVFTIQRWINEYATEPLTAVMPGVALQELWSTVGRFENAMLIVSAMVVGVALAGMVTAIFSGLNERRREMAILRSVGASARHIAGLLIVEAGLLAAAGAGIGLVLSQTGLRLAQSWVDHAFGLSLDVSAPGATELAQIAVVVGAGVLAGLLPALRAYKASLADGLMVKT